MSKLIRFIHISDTHIGPNKDFEQYGVNTYSCAQKLIAALNSLPFQPDFVVHTGDVTTDPSDAAYQLSQELFSTLKYPIYYATGNHDTSKDIKQYLQMGDKTDLSETLNSYYFDQGNIRFMALDARGPDEIDPHGQISEDQINIVKEQLERENKHFVLILHYPPIALDSPWLNENMLILEGDKFHNLLSGHAEKILSVQLGHVHRGIDVVKDSVRYGAVGSSFIQFRSYSSDNEVLFESTGESYFDIVTITNNTIITKHHAVDNGTQRFLKTK